MLGRMMFQPLLLAILLITQNATMRIQPLFLKYRRQYPTKPTGPTSQPIQTICQCTQRFRAFHQSDRVWRPSHGTTIVT